jgi:hypothetical protein
MLNRPSRSSRRPRSPRAQSQSRERTTCGSSLNLATSAGLDVPEAVRASRWLTPWSVEFRYGEDLENPLDRDAAVETIRHVERWAAELLGRG